MKNAIVLKDENLERTYQLTMPCVIGRGEEANLKIPEETISHRHALISEENGRVIIHDLGSKNGVLVNGKPVEGKAAINPGDSIQLGRVVLKYLQIETTAKADTIIFHPSDAGTVWNPDHQRLSWIYEMTVELSEHMDSPLLRERIFSRLKEVFRCDQFYVGVFQEDGSLKMGLGDSSPGEIPISRTIVNRLMQTGESFILADVLDEDSINMQESVVALRIRSAMCVPLVHRDNMYGLIYLACDVPGIYGRDDLAFLKTIAAILGPKIENARLWAEIRGLYDNAIETLKKTQSRLMSMERARAYVWLAQAMAHEIRNPVMVVGGLARRISQQQESTCSSKDNIAAIMRSVERVEAVLKEVDNFANLPAPDKKPERIDGIIIEEIESFREQLEKYRIHPVLSIDTSRLKIPLDSDLIRKALSLILREVPANIAGSSELKISVRDWKNDVEIHIGPAEAKCTTFEPLDADHGGKPSSLGLFLNLAHKIICEQGGELLLDPHGHSPFPMLIRMPRIN